MARASSQATYALLQPPSFNVLRDTDVRLGSIHPRTQTKPRRPDTKRTLNRAGRVDVPANLLRRDLTPTVILQSGGTRGGGAGVSVQLPIVQVIGGGIRSQVSSESFIYIQASNVETQWFLPDDEYFKQALKSVFVKEALFSFRAPSVFLVTGIKIAEHAVIIHSLDKNSSGHLNPELDLASLGIPLDVAVNINANRGDSRITAIEKQNCVLAFETRRIRMKNHDYCERDFNDFAMLDDAPGVDTINIIDALDFDEIATEVYDEHDDAD